MARISVLLVILLGVACSFDSGGPSGANPDGSGDGSNPDGSDVDGSNPDGSPGLSNGLDPANLQGATTHLDLTGNNKTFVIDTDTGRIIDCAGPELRPAGTGLMGGIHFVPRTVAGRAFGIGAFSLDRLSVDAGVMLYLVGANAAAFLSRVDVNIRGEVLVAGGVRACNAASACAGTGFQRCGGPGAFGMVETVGAESRWMSGGTENRAINAGPAPNLDISNGRGPGGGGYGAAENGGTLLELGGGGGGHASSGGDGGGMSNGGMTYSAGGLVPLAGGSGGGGGGGAGASAAGDGGGAGGGLQISSLTKIHLHSTGKINAGGAGGTAGTGLSANGGGGGGSGGAILLESRVLDLDGNIAANGGGGGSGSGVGEGPGANAGYDTDPAVGGGGTTSSVKGGSGAAGTTSATAGSGTGDGSGGGGGGGGRILLRTIAGGADAESAIISPPPVVVEDLQ